MSPPDDAVLLQPNMSRPIADPPASRRRAVRFTSNIVGPIFLLADLLCLLVSVPAALLAYDLLIGDRVIYSVHIFALTVLAASFLLLRSSKRAYRRTLVDLTHEGDDALVDAVISSLLASALVWQFGMIDNYSRGVSLLYLAFLLGSLMVSRPLIRTILNRMAARGAIEQRIAFYGADPQSIKMIRRLLESLDLPHLRFIGVADDRPKMDDLDGLDMIGGYEELADLARRGEVDQVLISVPNLPPKRLHDIVDGLSAVSVDVSLIPAEAIELAPDYRVHLLGSLPVLNLWQRPFRDINQFVKRGEDLILAVGSTGIAFADHGARGHCHPDHQSGARSVRPAEDGLQQRGHSRPQVPDNVHRQGRSFRCGSDDKERPSCHRRSGASCAV